ncbi:hypothetical protein ABKN59_006508 [Abortiporus biennis]
MRKLDLAINSAAKYLITPGSSAALLMLPMFCFIRRTELAGFHINLGPFEPSQPNLFLAFIFTDNGTE